jgi:hypothetical protein
MEICHKGHDSMFFSGSETFPLSILSSCTHATGQIYIPIEEASHSTGGTSSYQHLKMRSHNCTLNKHL